MDTGLDPLNCASKKIVHKAGEFLGNKTVDNDKIVKQELNEGIIIPLEKRGEILINKLRRVL